MGSSPSAEILVPFHFKRSRIFRLDEVDIDLRAEGGAEGDNERCQALNRFVIEEQVDCAEHRAAERDVGEHGTHHRFHEIALEGAAL